MFRDLTKTKKKECCREHNSNFPLRGGGRGGLWRGVLGFTKLAELCWLHEERKMSSVIITEDERAASDMQMKIFAPLTF